MGYYNHTVKPIGNFIEKDYGNNFEYSLNEDKDDFTLSIVENYPHKVWVAAAPDTVYDSGWRYAKVLKTVAYIIVDEDNDGPILERWFLKSNNKYTL